MSSLGLRIPLLLSLLLFPIQGVLAAATPYLNPGFHFDYNNDEPLPIPVTSQCQQIHLKWDRGSDDLGHSPVAPYFFQVYSSASSVPYHVPAGFGPSFDWVVPFAPNTQYQICMFDVNGISGGCQATYSMIPNTTTTQPSCQNVTAPSALSVSAQVQSDPMTQFSEIDQCTNLTVTPNAGSPPFILTVAPDLHPPYNITSTTMGSITWQASLPAGNHFFLSLASADGLMWSNGPMVVGVSRDSSCLAPDTVPKGDFTKFLIASSVGGFGVGILAGLLGVFFYLRYKRRSKKAITPFYEPGSFASRNNLNQSPKPLSVLTSPSLSAFPPVSQDASYSDTSNPPMPLRPARPSIHRQNSIEQSDESSTSSMMKYPADIKRPLPTSPTSSSSHDDVTSILSSSSNRRHLSILSRAPTYVPRSTLRNTMRANNQTTTMQPVQDDPLSADLPPQYGTHTADPSLNYAPNVLSSGYRF